MPTSRAGAGVSALLGPTNTGKTHRAIEQLLSHRSGMIGLPLRLLAREVYDRVTARIGEQQVALVTGEEKRIPPRPRYWICTVESMPVDLEVDFVCIDEIQLAAHRQRGHTFTDRLLHARGVAETWFLGSDAMVPALQELVPTAHVQRHPRFSKLTYGGAVSVGALPPRTAVVAFSVAEVYELAEHLRQRHGGTAVVLGALSPRARNAQVAMYESGEVEYMVATDAIGMGLNLDLDRVVFASTHKYDGRESRPLTPSELGQIAGRAGRYTRDGTFAVLRPQPALDDRIVHAIENHAFEPVRQVVWRNSDLDFSSLAGLEASLRARPRRTTRLRMLEQADDFDALGQLARLSSVRKRARGEEAVALLWDVCRIPDFRKLMLESHVQLLARIYDQLSSAQGQLDEVWMRRRIERLDDVGGDIDTLMTRMAFIRTWTYIANHERWVPNASHWQALTRSIEDRMSDALHNRLTERFVAKTMGTPTRPAGRRRAAPKAKVARGEPPDPNNPFAALAGLAVGASEPEVDQALERVESIVGAAHEAFEVDAKGRIRCDGLKLGRWKRGRDLLHPEVLVEAEGWTTGARARLQRRLQAWTVDAVAPMVAALEPLLGAPEPARRGVAYVLQRTLGTVVADDVRDEVGALRPEDRAAFEDAGVVLGVLAVYVARGVRPENLAVRRALCWVHAPWGDAAAVDPARPSWPRVQGADLAALGYVPMGELAVRVDVAERVAAAMAVEASSAARFPVPGSVARWLECSPRELTGVVESLGYRAAADGTFARSRSRRSGARS
ncbi:MAG: helicase-related protein [Nannocystaceae bacterium]|nr:helicase-related protein [bacterium]